MDAEVFDAIIVGAGQAGPAIAARCSREGLKTAVIERHHFGGDPLAADLDLHDCPRLGRGGREIGHRDRGAEGG